MLLPINRLLIVCGIAALLAAVPLDSAFARGRHGGAAATPGAGPLAGRVVSGANRGIAGARIVLKAAARPFLHAGAKPHARGTGEHSHKTNRRGHFKFRHLAPGRYALTIVKPGFYPKTLFVSPGHNDLVIHLPGAARVAALPAIGRRRGRLASAQLLHDEHALHDAHDHLNDHLHLPGHVDLHLPHINGHTPLHPIHPPTAPHAPQPTRSPTNKKKR